MQSLLLLDPSPLFFILISSLFESSPLQNCIIFKQICINCRVFSCSSLTVLKEQNSRRKMQWTVLQCIGYQIDYCCFFRIVFSIFQLQYFCYKSSCITAFVKPRNFVNAFKRHTSITNSFQTFKFVHKMGVLWRL